MAGQFSVGVNIQRLLEVMAPKGSVLQTDEVHNHVVVSGSSADRLAIHRLIDNFDVDQMKGVGFMFVHLQNMAPDKFIDELKQIYRPPSEFIGQRVRLVPMERIQAILAMARDPADLAMLEDWARRLDIARKAGGRSLHVYNVQHGRAKDLAVSLQLVLNGGAAGGASAPQAPQGSKTDASSNSPVQATALLSNESASQSRVVANDENNSLLILGTEAEYELVRDALAKLDVLPRQVLIEAVLAEVTLNEDLQFGVQWFLERGSTQATFSSNDSGSVAGKFPGFSLVYSHRDSVRVVLSALQSKTDVKVLSAPKLAVLNNQKATLQVGDEVPIRTQVSQSTAAPGTPIVSSIEMRDTGVILDVTPRVNDNGNVILDISQEVSDVATTTTSGIDSPTIQRRKIRSVIATRDGSTVALGGLIRENTSRSESKVPLLGDLPLVGHLFKTQAKDTRRTELIVLLVPHVMRDANETQQAVEDLINGARAAAEMASHAIRIPQRPPE